jgi:hypothetical protein
MEGKQRSAKIHTTLWHKFIRRKHNNDRETPNPNSSQKKENQGPWNCDLTMIYQHHYLGNKTRNWIKGYFLVFCNNRSLNQNKKNTQACWKNPNQKAWSHYTFLQKATRIWQSNHKPLQTATSKKDRQQAASNSNYLRGTESNAYPKLCMQEVHRARSCRVLQCWQTLSGRSSNVLQCQKLQLVAMLEAPTLKLSRQRVSKH